MYVVPDQPQDLPHTQGTGKGQMHSDQQLPVIAGVQCPANGIGIPNVPLGVFRLRHICTEKRVFPDHVPAHSLLEGTTEQFDDFLDGLIRQKLGPGLSGLGADRSRLPELHNVRVHDSGIDRLHLHVSDDRIDVVLDERGAAVIH